MRRGELKRAGILAASLALLAAPSNAANKSDRQTPSGLPVQVVAETLEWRRICDPERGLAWVHRRTTDGRRMAMRLKPEPLAIHAKSDAASRIVAFLEPRSLADLDRCNKDGWCKLKAGRESGWVPAAEVWGTAETPQCR